MKRRYWVGVAMVSVVALGAAGLYGFVIIPARADRAIAAARRQGGAVREVRVSRGTPRRLDAPGREGVTVFTATREARDGATAFGSTWIATGGGVQVVGDGGRLARTLTWADGLGSADATAMTAYGGRLAIGAADGSVTLIDGAMAEVVRFQTGGAGAAVTDLAADGDLLYVATFGAGMIVWDGSKAAAFDTASGGESMKELTAMAAGPGRLAVGTADGALFVRQDGRLARIDRGSDAEREKSRITALAWDGDTLLIGTPFALERLDGGASAAKVVRADTFVTSIVVEHAAGRTYVGTFDDGVVVLEAGGAERRMGGRARITRLRAEGDRVLAFGAGGAWDLTAGEAAPLLVDAPPSLSGGHVTAIAPRAGELWIGTFDAGIDVLGEDGRLVRHLPRAGAAYGADQVNRIVPRPAERDVLVATVRGVTQIGDDGTERHRGTADDLIGDQVQDVTSLAGVVAYATNRGLTVLGTDGVARSLYALEGLANNHCYAVAWGGGGRLYVGTLGGLSIVSPELAVEKSIGSGPGALRAAWVTALAAAPEGMYVGTYGGGVSLVSDAGAVDDVGRELRGPKVNPGAMLVDGDRVLVGTLDDGLLVYERSARRWRHVDESLGSRNVTAVAATGEAIWIGTDRGLVRLSRAVLDRALGPAPQS